ncbi:hypothetical protein [uncultured Tateyamaria sp.]|uniref:hypothetical protein n=1 Tax=uncultured Tateyamaria sp. TaxID=455651 RepID=UPI00261AD121|nr:hypothetical protein [uncultured Tateyamaria sp.]
MRDDFTATTKRLLAERAGYRCSNPDCRKTTVGPSTADQAKSISQGVAAHICAAQDNGPRYNSEQTALQRKSASNGIWLCGACATLIDKNNGADFKESVLQIWKELHEEAVFSELSTGQSDIGLTGWCEEENGSWILRIKNPTTAPFLDCVARAYRVENFDEPFADIEVVFGTIPPRQTISDAVPYENLESSMFGHPVVEVEYTDVNGIDWLRERTGRIRKIEFRRPFD